MTKRRRYYPKKKKVSIVEQIVTVVLTEQGMKYTAMFAWIVFAAWVFNRTSQGAVSIFEWLLLVGIPAGYWYHKTMKRNHMIQGRSLDYVRTLELMEVFRPSQHYDNEIYYQRELYGYLMHNMPGVKIEMEDQRGSSRPDIVVNSEVSIEVKGPTSAEALTSLGDKCVRYSTRFEHVIIICFAVHATETRYQEVDQGIKRQFPNIVMLRVDKDKQGRKRNHKIKNNPVNKKPYLAPWTPRKR